MEKTVKDMYWSNDMYWSYCVALCDFINLSGALAEDACSEDFESSVIELANSMSKSRFLLLSRTVEKPSFLIKFDVHDADNSVCIVYRSPLTRNEI